MICDITFAKKAVTCFDLSRVLHIPSVLHIPPRWWNMKHTGKVEACTWLPFIAMQGDCSTQTCIPYTGWPPKKRNSQFFLGLYSDQQFYFFTLLDRAYFLYYNNTKIIKFGWEIFILWAISYGLSFPGFAINLSLLVLFTEQSIQWIFRTLFWSTVIIFTFLDKNIFSSL